MNPRPINNPGQLRPNLSGIRRLQHLWVEPKPSSGRPGHGRSRAWVRPSESRWAADAPDLAHEGCSGTADRACVNMARRRIGRPPCPASTDGSSAPIPHPTPTARCSAWARGATSWRTTRRIVTAGCSVTLVPRTATRPLRQQSCAGWTRHCSPALPGAWPASWRRPRRSSDSPMRWRPWGRRARAGLPAPAASPLPRTPSAHRPRHPRSETRTRSM